MGFNLDPSAKLQFCNSDQPPVLRFLSNSNLRPPKVAPQFLKPRFPSTYPGSSRSHQSIFLKSHYHPLKEYSNHPPALESLSTRKIRIFTRITSPQRDLLLPSATIELSPSRGYKIARHDQRFRGRESHE